MNHGKMCEETAGEFFFSFVFFKLIMCETMRENHIKSLFVLFCKSITKSIMDGSWMCRHILVNFFVQVFFH